MKWKFSKRIRVHSVLIQNFDGDYSVAELGAQNITDGGEVKYFHALAKELNLPLQDSYVEFSSFFYDGKDFIEVNPLLKKLNFNQATLKAFLKSS